MRASIIGLVFCLVAAVLIGCGSEEGNTGALDADTMTVVVSGTTKTYTEGLYNGYGYLDPSLSSQATTSSTYVGLCSGVTETSCETLVNISIAGTALHSYSTSTTTYIMYRINNRLYSTLYSSTTGTVMLTATGQVGEKIEGSFDAVVALSGNTGPKTISGSFSVKRIH